MPQLPSKTQQQDASIAADPKTSNIRSKKGAAPPSPAEAIPVGPLFPSTVAANLDVRAATHRSGYKPAAISERRGRQAAPSPRLNSDGSVAPDPTHRGQTIAPASDPDKTSTLLSNVQDSFRKRFHRLLGLNLNAAKDDALYTCQSESSGNSHRSGASDGALSDDSDRQRGYIKHRKELQKHSPHPSGWLVQDPRSPARLPYGMPIPPPPLDHSLNLEKSLERHPKKKNCLNALDKDDAADAAANEALIAAASQTSCEPGSEQEPHHRFESLCHPCDGVSNSHNQLNKKHGPSTLLSSRLRFRSGNWGPSSSQDPNEREAEEPGRRPNRLRGSWSSHGSPKLSSALMMQGVSGLSQLLHPSSGGISSQTPPVPPTLMQQSDIATKMYYINHEWKSVFSKLLVVIYMSAIWWIIFQRSDPWYEFFYYLTLQGWTLELIYFIFSLYLDCLSRYYGGPEYISRISKAAAQALSELVFALQVVIVIFFWAVVYPQETWRRVAWEINCHGIGLLLILVDYLYRFTGFSLRNHRYVVFFSVAYAVFHVAVVLVIGRPIYPGIHFKDVWSFMIFLAGLSAVVLTHKTAYLISNWQFIQQDVKSLLGISSVLLFRQNSLDMFARGVSDFGSELFSLSPKAAPYGAQAVSRADFQDRGAGTIPAAR